MICNCKNKREKHLVVMRKRFLVAQNAMEIFLKKALFFLGYKKRPTEVLLYS
jgi:hypothetical protein